MLTLKMFKDRARFEWSDGEVESVVSLSADDSQESVVRKLKRVIALVEGGHPPPASVQDYQLEPTFRVGIDPAGDSVAVVQQPTNGWATYVAHEAPELPERLLGEVELVQPGEDA